VYFYNMKALKVELSNNKLSEAEIIKYVIAMSIIQILHAQAIIHSLQHGRFVLSAYLLPVIALVGVYVCYRANGGEHGKYFLNRLAAVTWVVTVWYITFGIILSIALAILFPYFKLADLHGTLGLVVGLLVNVSIWGGICYYLHSLGKLNPRQDTKAG